MTVTMDKSGRVVIPKELRKAANLQAETPLEIRLENGGVVIEAPSIEPQLVMRNGLAVMSFPKGGPQLTDFDLNRIREEIENERFPGLFVKE